MPERLQIDLLRWHARQGLYGARREGAACATRRAAPTRDRSWLGRLSSLRLSGRFKVGGGAHLGGLAAASQVARAAALVTGASTGLECRRRLWCGAELGAAKGDCLLWRS
ncbi:hypothetical protein GCM10020219_045160 [Nonomuraea dietziae]